MPRTTFITTTEAAQILGVTKRAVRFMITNGRLPAVRVGDQYNIDERDLAKVMNQPRRGRKAKA